MTHKEKSIQTRRIKKIQDVLARYRTRVANYPDMNKEYIVMYTIVKNAYHVNIRRLNLDQMDAYVAEIIEVAKWMNFPETELFCNALANLYERHIRPNKVEWARRKKTQSKLYSIDMSKAEYDAVLKFLKQLRAE